MSIQARCVRIAGRGGPEVLEVGELTVPEPGPGQIRVRVAAAGVNRADVLQRMGFYPAPPGVPRDVPGLEYAGEVEAVGPGAGLSVGDRVMGIVAGGAMATHLVVDQREALPIPSGLSLVDAAAVPEVFLTAFDALALQAEVRLEEVVLVHAVGSGVGTAAVQLARLMGARPLGTTRTRAKLERLQGVAPVEGLWVEDGRFAEAVAERTGGRGADVILDTVGAAYLEENVQALAPGGRLVVLGLMGGATGSLPLGRLLPKRGRVFASVLRSRPLEEKATLAQAFARQVLPAFSDGRLRPVVDAVLPMAAVSDAHRRLEANDTFGKIVLTWDGG